MKKIISLLLATLLIAGLAACGTPEETITPEADITPTPEAAAPTPEPTPEDVRHRIAFIANETGDDSQMMMSKGLEEVMRAYESDYYAFGPEDGTAESQSKLIETMMERDIEAIVLRPVAEGDVSAAVNAAMEKGIKVVTVAFEPMKLGDVRVSGVDKQKQAADMVAELSQKLGGQGDILLFSGAQDDADYKPIVEAIQAELQKSDYAGLKLMETVYEPKSEGDTAKAKIGEYLKSESTPTPDASASPTTEGGATPTPEQSATPAPDDSASPDASATPTATPQPAALRVDGVICLNSASTGAVAKEIKSAKAQDKVCLIGGGRPSLLADWVEAGICSVLYVTSSYDVGMLAGYVANKLLIGELELAEGASFFSGRVGERALQKDSQSLFVEVGIPSKVTAENINTWKKIW